MQKLKELYVQHEAMFATGFFVVGFLFDIFTLGRIDDWWNILQQAIYLLILGAILTADISLQLAKKEPPSALQKIWPYREAIIHFLFGSLLSVYTIFYFKSSSFLSSFVFVAVIAGLLVLNELPRFQKIGPIIRTLLYSLCLSSFFAFLFPIALGFLGWIPFLLAIASGSLIVGFIFYLLTHKFGEKEFLQKTFLFPAIAIKIFFLAAYAVGIIPPVPLSVNYIGVYHSAHKENDQYVMGYTRPEWKFWQNGDQTFEARPNDKLHVFVNVFSPTNFRDKIHLHFLNKDSKMGWTTWDKIPIEIRGGREEGFRGVAFKNNYAPGSWMVRVETADNREIGRLYFSIETSLETGPVEYHFDRL